MAGLFDTREVTNSAGHWAEIVEALDQAVEDGDVERNHADLLIANIETSIDGAELIEEVTITVSRPERAALRGIDEYDGNAIG